MSRPQTNPGDESQFIDCFYHTGHVHHTSGPLVCRLDLASFQYGVDEWILGNGVSAVFGQIAIGQDPQVLHIRVTPHNSLQ